MPLSSVILENEFVVLEPLAERHREDLRAAGDDPDLWRFASVNQHGVDFDAWVDHRLNDGPAAGDLTFTIHDKRIDAIVGSSSYLAVSLPDKRLEIGWTWYSKAAWGTAVNPACKHLLLTHGFEVLDLNRVELKLDATNTRSFRAVERLGAKFEGIHRSHMVMSDGRIRDSAFFSIICDEWPVVKNGLEERLRSFRQLERIHKKCVRFLVSNPRPLRNLEHVPDSD